MHELNHSKLFNDYFLNFLMFVNFRIYSRQEGDEKITDRSNSMQVLVS